jgi:hypothetical protein
MEEEAECKRVPLLLPSTGGACGLYGLCRQRSTYCARTNEKAWRICNREPTGSCTRVPRTLAIGVRRVKTWRCLRSYQGRRVSIGRQRDQSCRHSDSCDRTRPLRDTLGGTAAVHLRLATADLHPIRSRLHRDSWILVDRRQTTLASGASPRLACFRLGSRRLAMHRDRRFLP